MLTPFEIARDALFGDPLGSRINPNKNRLLDAFSGLSSITPGVEGQTVVFDADGVLTPVDVDGGKQPAAAAIHKQLAGYRGLVRHQYVVEGPGAGSIAQYFDVHPFTGDRYSINRIGATDDHVFVRHGPDGTIRLPIADRSDVSDLVPHQGFFFLPSLTTPSDPYIISSAGYGQPASENFISRTRYRAAGTAMTFELVQVFDDGAGRGSSSPAMSPCGNFIMVRKLSETTDEYIYKVYDANQLLDAFDNGQTNQVDTYLSMFTIPSVTPTGDPVPNQGNLIDENFIYAFCGFGDTRGPLGYIVTKHDGTVVAENYDWDLAFEQAAVADRSASDVSNNVFPREVESARWVEFDGKLRPELSVGVGSSGARTNLIFIMDVGAPLERNKDYWIDTLDVVNSTPAQSFEVEFRREDNQVFGHLKIAGLDGTAVTQANLELRGLRYGSIERATFAVVTSRYDRQADLVGILNPGTTTDIEFREVTGTDFLSGIMDASMAGNNSASYLEGTISYFTDFRDGS